MDTPEQLNEGNDSGAPVDAPVTDTPATPEVDELAYLKDRATKLGISFGPRIGIEALREKINAKLEPEPATPVTTNAHVLSEREQLINDAMKLVRIRIVNLDPKKKDLPGEIVTVANEFIGTVRKFIPFTAEASENGYHVPNVIYQFLKEKRFQAIRTFKDPRTGQERVERRHVPEYGLEVLPQLMPEELEELKVAQAAAGSVSN